MRELLELLSAHVEEGADSVVIRFGGGSLALTDDYALVLNSLLCHVAVHADRREVVLDFSNVTFVSSVGLGILVALHKWLLAGGRRLVVRDPDDTVCEALEAAGLIAMLDGVLSAPARRRPDHGILVADDDELVRHLLHGALRRYGFRVVLAATGRDAAERLRQDPCGIALVLLDVNMPGLSGPATLALLRAISPGLTCCFMTGDQRPYAVETLLAFGAARVLAKPFSVSDVLHILRDLAGGAGVWPRDKGATLP
jgi:anti-anti-sigma factor